MTLIYYCEYCQKTIRQLNTCPFCKLKIKLINHRPLIKILINPLIRIIFSKEIVSIFDENDNFIKYEIRNLK